MQEACLRANGRNPELGLDLCIGVNAGEPIHEDGDIFGTPVQLAARVLSKAEGDEIAVSNLVREMCTGKNYKFTKKGEYELEADGCIMITGSHNPAEYNGIKMTMGRASIYGDAILALCIPVDAEGLIDRSVFLHDRADQFVIVYYEHFLHQVSVSSRTSPTFAANVSGAKGF